MWIAGDYLSEAVQTGTGHTEHTYINVTIYATCSD